MEHNISSPQSKDDQFFIEKVISLAKKNIKAGGVPFACLIVNSSTREILAEATSQITQTGDPTAHSEILAIREASKKLHSKGINVSVEGLKGYTFYVLTDPCPMSMLAIQQCNADQIVYCLSQQEYYLSKEVTYPNKEIPLKQCLSSEAKKIYEEWKNVDKLLQTSSQKPKSNGISITRHGLEIYKDPGVIDEKRKEIEYNNRKIPAWGDPKELEGLFKAKDEAFDELIKVVAVRGDPLKEYYMCLRDIHLMMRENYANMIFNVGRNIYPLIVAADYEVGTPSGIGSSFTLYLEDGTYKRIAPAPPEYEMYKSLGHMPLGLFTIVSPYFMSPHSLGWKPQLQKFQGKVNDALYSLEASGLSSKVKEHGRGMLHLVNEYISSSLEKNSVTVSDYMAFTKKLLPYVQKSVANAARLQAHAALPELQKWKEELGEKWKDVYFLIPTVWPVSGRNPRQQIIEQLIDPDRIKTHIIKAEGARDIEEAKTTLGRVVGDRTVAHLVFGIDTPDARGLTGALSTPRDIVCSACDDALDELKK